MTARDIMTAAIATLPPDCPIAEAVRRFRDTRHLGIPVVDPAGCLLGIVNVWQILSKALPSYIASGDLADVRFAPDLGQFHDRLSRLGPQPISTIMDRHPSVVRPNHSVLECSALILSTPKPVHLLPVVDEANRLVGVITPFDLVKEIA